MRRLHVPGGLGLMAAVALLAGCDAPAPTSAPPPAAPRKQAPLPELGEAIGPLDEGRLQAAPPAGWMIPPRSSDWIVRFKASKQTNYPTIIVTAEDYEAVFNVAKDNVGEFARQIAAQFKETGEASKLAKEVEPLEVKGRWGITYGRRARVNKMIVDRLFFETVVSGRKYRFELRTLAGSAGQYRPHLLATVSGVKFLEAEQPAPAETPAEEPPEQPPEDPAEKPPETKPEEDPFT